MGHKCFISYKSADMYYKEKLVELFDKSDVIDKSLDYVINSSDPNYILSVIRRNYLSDSTVTIFLIGTHSSENEGYDWRGNPHNYYIQHELQASLYDGDGNTRSGIVGVVLPEMYSKIYKGSYTCSTCNRTHNYVDINDSTVIREFSENYYVKPHEGCGWSESERYCVLVKWDDFIKSPEDYIELAFNKRTSEISKKVKVRISR